MDVARKVRENRLRLAAKRLGLRIQKSRRRDPRVPDFGRYWLLHTRSNILVIGASRGVTLDDIEAYLGGR